MAMRTTGKMLALTLVVVLAFSFLEVGTGVIRYPGAEVVFERSYFGVTKIFQVSGDSFETIDRWYNEKLKSAQHTDTAGLLEANIVCSNKKWVDGKFTVSVIICDYPDHRTISTQVSKV